MKKLERSSKLLTVGLAVVLLGGCASTPYDNPYYSAPPPPPPAAAEQANPTPQQSDPDFLTVGPEDRFYVMHVENNTPFEIRFPQAHHVLYEKGYDQVRRQREADFALDISLFAESRDNPNVRGQHMLGSAILGAATGALFGAAGGRPVLGTIVGASTGAALGLTAPANTPMVRIQIQTRSFRDGTTSGNSVVVDMEQVPPHDVQRVVDIQVSKMLESLPAR